MATAARSCRRSPARSRTRRTRSSSPGSTTAHRWCRPPRPATSTSVTSVTVPPITGAAKQYRLQDRRHPARRRCDQGGREHHRAQGFADPDAGRPQGQADRRAAGQSAHGLAAARAQERGADPEGRRVRLPQPGSGRHRVQHRQGGRVVDLEPAVRDRGRRTVPASSPRVFRRSTRSTTTTWQATSRSTTRSDARRWPTCSPGSRAILQLGPAESRRVRQGHREGDGCLARGRQGHRGRLPVQGHPVCSPRRSLGPSRLSATPSSRPARSPRRSTSQHPALDNLLPDGFDSSKRLARGAPTRRESSTSTPSSWRPVTTRRPGVCRRAIRTRTSTCGTGSRLAKLAESGQVRLAVPRRRSGAHRHR